MTGNDARAFEDVVARIFRLSDLVATREARVGKYFVDILLSNSEGLNGIVEVKLYRSIEVPVQTLLNAAAQLEVQRSSTSATKAILAVSAVVSNLDRKAISARYPNVLVFDYDVLRALASTDIEVLTEFEDVIRNANPSVPSPAAPQLAPPLDEIIQAATKQEHKAPNAPTTGSKIAKRLRQIDAGPENAKKFEATLEEALKYIFAEHLVAWQRELNVDGNISRFDLIARVASRHAFWTMIANAFRSHYIIFEFKNYDKEIKQGQIYTTEKYLYTTALRSTAIIISPKGPDKNAAIAARGALRESGKLIMNITVDQVCEMLTRKDEGNDPNGILVDELDQMLMRLTR